MDERPWRAGLLSSDHGSGPSWSDREAYSGLKRPRAVPWKAAVPVTVMLLGEMGANCCLDFLLHSEAFVTEHLLLGRRAQVSWTVCPKEGCGGRGP